MILHPLLLLASALLVVGAPSEKDARDPSPFSPGESSELEARWWWPFSSSEQPLDWYNVSGIAQDYGVAIDSKHICKNDIVPFVTRPGGQKQNMTMGDMTAAIAKDPDTELQLLKQDAQAAIDDSAFIINNIGICSSPVTAPAPAGKRSEPEWSDFESSEFEPRDLGLSEIDARELQSRANTANHPRLRIFWLTLWKSTWGFIPIFALNILNNYINLGRPLSDAIAAAPALAGAVSLVLFGGGIVDIIAYGHDDIPFPLIAVWRFVVGTMVSVWNVLRNTNWPCADWNSLIRFLSGGRFELARIHNPTATGAVNPLAPVKRDIGGGISAAADTGHPFIDNNANDIEAAMNMTGFKKAYEAGGTCPKDNPSLQSLLPK